MFAYKNNVFESAPAAPAARRVTVQVVRREVLMHGVVRLSLALPGTWTAPAPAAAGECGPLRGAACGLERWTAPGAAPLAPVGRSRAPARAGSRVPAFSLPLVARGLPRVPEFSAAPRAPAPYIPGQFITLALPTQRQTLYRSYSLCGTGQPGQPWVITVKRQHMGVVSSYLYDHAREGMIFQASLPQGTFVLPACIVPGAPFIFVAAGSGITPIIGMLSALALLPPERRPVVQLHYASRAPAEMIYLRELEALDPQSRWLHRWYYFSARGARLTAQGVLSSAGHLATRAHWYICGPDVLKRDLQRLLESYAVPAPQVHVETFASPASSNISQSPVAASSTSARLRVADTGAVLDVQPHETLLTALERHGYDPDYSCRAGACGTCKLRLLGGRVHPVGAALSPAERQAGYVLGCVARPVGDVVIASAGQPPSRMLASASTGRGPFRRQAAIRRVRALTAVAALGLVVGSWGLVTGKIFHSQTASPISSSSQPPANSAASDDDDSSSGSSAAGSAPSNPVSVPAPVPTTQSGTS
jgi:ferredoxin-NADP reductase